MSNPVSICPCSGNSTIKARGSKERTSQPIMPKIWMKSMHPTQMPRSGTNKNFAGVTNKNPNIFHFEMGPRGYTLLSTLQLGRCAYGLDDSTTDKSTYTYMNMNSLRI